MVGILEKRKVGEIEIEYCVGCYRYQIQHPSNLVFHGVNAEHLRQDVLKPQEPDMTFYRRYLELLDRPQLHLGNYDMAGPNNYDFHFAFDIRRLVEASPEIRFMDHQVWCQLAFFDDASGLTKKDLFLPEFKEGCEVVVDSLDLRLAEFALFYSEDKKPQGLKLKQYNAHPIKEIIDLYEQD